MTTRQRSSSSSSSTAQYESAQVQEWGKYRARVAIDFYGTRAYNVGDPVPASAVDGDGAWVSPEFVEQSGTPFEGSQTVVDPAPPTVDPSTVAAPVAASPVPTTQEA